MQLRQALAVTVGVAVVPEPADMPMRPQVGRGVFDGAEELLGTAGHFARVGHDAVGVAAKKQSSFSSQFR